MKKSLVAMFIGGVIIIAGVFAPWASSPGVSAPSGWESFNVTALAGGLLVLIGVLAELVYKSNVFLPLVPVGAIFALVNGIQVVRSATSLPYVLGVGGVATAGYGILLCISGAVLSLFGVFWYGKGIFKPRIKRKKKV